MTDMQENPVNIGEGASKSSLIRAELSKGNQSVSGIRDALRAQGVDAGDNLIHTVKQKWRKAHSTQIAPGVTRVRAVETANQQTSIAARPGSKKEAILNLYRSGVTKGSEIMSALKTQGIESSANNVYVVLAELKEGKKGKSLTRVAQAAPAKAPAASAPKPKAPLTRKEAAPLHPELVTLMQAAALQFGSAAVEEAASHVATRSREMINNVFRVA